MPDQEQQTWPHKGEGMQYWGSAPPVGSYRPPRTRPLEWAGSWFTFTALVIVGIVLAHFWTPALYVFGALLVLWAVLRFLSLRRERLEFKAETQRLKSGSAG
jgi:hypothetical protein